ncbi:hypothetical protein PAXRUDRAFT_15256 [Paxillus rubicundulus Ve08.2h10]|uniref:Uncharacterized protein n=1 Tax=Paxillus rubicundulus Ve08.2h10 TaxID=930991 RepID=A0A0D0DIP2_9AGAM|nr:hypothetical protein PAXRUDRAFT_15256 [Paxillus rubicundulus Ve08.2h10]
MPLFHHPPSNTSDSPIKSASEDDSFAIEWALTSKEEDMPPEMQEEEGEEDDDCAERDKEDEKEGEDIDVIEESHQTTIDELQRGLKKENSGDHAWPAL